MSPGNTEQTTATETIERIIASGLLTPSLVFLPAAGANRLQIATLEAITVRPLSAQHRALLARWNGANLEVIRLLGTGITDDNIPTIESHLEYARTIAPGSVPIANDPSGFIYLEMQNGTITCMDDAHENFEQIAIDINHFFSDAIFGIASGSLFGEDWLNDLRTIGIV